MCSDAGIVQGVEFPPLAVFRADPQKYARATCRFAYRAGKRRDDSLEGPVSDGTLVLLASRWIWFFLLFFGALCLAWEMTLRIWKLVGNPLRACQVRELVEYEGRLQCHACVENICCDGRAAHFDRHDTCPAYTYLDRRKRVGNKSLRCNPAH